MKKHKYKDEEVKKGEKLKISTAHWKNIHFIIFKTF